MNRDANYVNLNVNDDVMVHVPNNNGEIEEYEGTVVELLPKNKVRVEAEDRTFVLDGKCIYSLMEAMWG